MSEVGGVIRHEPVLRPFAGEEEIGAGLVGCGAQAGGERDVSVVDEAGGSVAVVGGEVVFDGIVVADFVPEPAGGAEGEELVEFAGGDVAIGGAAQVHDGAAMVVDAFQLGGGVIAVAALLVGNEVRIGGGELVELVGEPRGGRCRPN